MDLRSNLKIFVLLFVFNDISASKLAFDNFKFNKTFTDAAPGKDKFVL
jgi:hypothetical protein